MASIINANTSGGLISTGDTSGQLQLQTAGTTALTVDSSQNVGVGTTSPSANLHVKGTAPNQTNFIVSATSSDLLRVQPQASGTGVYLQATNNAQSAYANMGFYATGYTFNVGNITLGTSNAGIIFNNGSALTNSTFNDYETGTWTPSLGGSATYLAQGGRYTKMGRIVSFQGVLYINVIGSGSTTVISGLPFSIATVLGGAVCAAPSYGGIATAISSMNLNVAGTNITCQSNITASTGNQSTNAIFANSTYLEFSGVYQATF